MVQDCFERGMIAGHYDTDLLKSIIGDNTNWYDEFIKDFEIVIRTKDRL